MLNVLIHMVWNTCLIVFFRFSCHDKGYILFLSFECILLSFRSRRLYNFLALPDASRQSHFSVWPMQSFILTQTTLVLVNCSERYFN